MLPQFDKDLHKVVNESVSLLPDKPDNELYKSFLTVANDSSGFLKLLFSKSQQKNYYYCSFSNIPNAFLFITKKIGI